MKNKKLLYAIVIIAILVIVSIDFFTSNKMIFTKLDSQFQFKINQVALIEYGNIKIKFLNVIQDSRCPSDVVCVRAGDVAILVNINKNNKNLGDFMLIVSPGNEDLAIEIFDGYSVKLIKVDPYPTTSKKIELSDYIATLIVNKQ
jgi:hypothetical protein